MSRMKDISGRLEAMAKLVNKPEAWDFSGCEAIYAGVDIGTHSVISVVVDQAGMPRAALLEKAEVVKSGLIVDYVGALEIVRRQMEALRAACPLEIDMAATTYPPNTEQGNIRTTSHILEAVGLEVTAVLDEPSAANRVLGLDKGAIVDVGGGTTGIAVMDGGEVIYSDDEATGGVHLSLVLAGGMRISPEEAEAIKADKARAKEVMGLVGPVVDKISSIVDRHLARWPEIEEVCLVGGTCELEGLAEAVTKYLGRTAVRPVFPQGVTPLGVALACRQACRAGLNAESL